MHIAGNNFRQRSMSWPVTVITLMPEMYPGPLAHSLIGQALANRTFSLDVINLRDFGVGRHQQVDDSPYGGGAGLVLKPDVVDAAICEAKTRQPKAELIVLTPRGERLIQPMLLEFSQKPIILFAGRYEAVDERVLEKHRPREVSLGDFVLTGGDIPALALIEGAARLLPGVVGDAESLAEESFGLSQDYACLLEYPHYTKPPVWEGRPIPEILLSGHHAHIARWRKAQAEAITQDRRPDLWEKYKTAQR
jgi:tRNA (guanine37-N1)-methyltransferase